MPEKIYRDCSNTPRLLQIRTGNPNKSNLARHSLACKEAQIQQISEQARRKPECPPTPLRKSYFDVDLHATFLADRHILPLVVMVVSTCHIFDRLWGNEWASHRVHILVRGRRCCTGLELRSPHRFSAFIVMSSGVKTKRPAFGRLPAMKCRVVSDLNVVAKSLFSSGF